MRLPAYKWSSRFMDVRNHRRSHQYVARLLAEEADVRWRKSGMMERGGERWRELWSDRTVLVSLDSTCCMTFEKFTSKRRRAATVTVDGQQSANGMGRFNDSAHEEKDRSGAGAGRRAAFDFWFAESTVLEYPKGNFSASPVYYVMVFP
ncbi:hypothetical protein EVAR_64496_1 [Eumeta japonica]|uniref:Uncharacterized protein n=1 Tax=Eumeta variegata TaxID=151549 RepID=A0A4C1Z5B6_EUMVA|nr:hypothetical protein EVAR_64496_1 [Eumeta japonica]